MTIYHYGKTNKTIQQRIDKRINEKDLQIGLCWAGNVAVSAIPFHPDYKKEMKAEEYMKLLFELRDQIFDNFQSRKSEIMEGKKIDETMKQEAPSEIASLEREAEQEEDLKVEQDNLQI